MLMIQLIIISKNYIYDSVYAMLPLCAKATQFREFRALQYLAAAKI
jgi:hypothetical protein